MILHEAGHLGFQIGALIAAVRSLTWLVALFGSKHFSKRAMFLLRRRTLEDERSVLEADQSDVLHVLISHARCEEIHLDGVAVREKDELPTGDLQAGHDLTLETPAANHEISDEQQHADRDYEAA